MLNEKNLNLAGWLSVVSAVLALPVLIISFISGILEDKSATLLYLEALLNTGYVVLYVYILIMFRRLLNEKSAFHDVDKYFTFLIWINISITVIGIIALPFPEAQSIIGIGVLVLLIPFGVIYMVFGIKLLNCEDNLFGYLKPFSYMTIVTGAMIAVIVLALLGIITTMISDVILALIFFKAAKLIQTQGSLTNV